MRSRENRTKHRGRIAFGSESTKSTGNIAIYPVIPFFTSSYHIRRTSEISNLHLRENSRLPCGNIKTDIAYHRESNKITSLSQWIQIYPTNLFTTIHIKSCKPQIGSKAYGMLCILVVFMNPCQRNRETFERNASLIARMVSHTIHIQHCLFTRSE